MKRESSPSAGLSPNSPSAVPLLAASGDSNVLFWSYCLLGCGILAPWCALLSAVDYFEAVYPDRNSLRWITFAYLTALAPTLFLNGLFPSRDRGHRRVSWSLFLYSLAFLFIPVVDLVLVRNNEGTTLAFLLLLTCVFVVGMLNGLAEGSFVGLSLQLTPRYSQAYLVGYALSGIVNVSLRALTKAILTDSSSGLRTSAQIYFCVATLFCLACWATHRFVIMPHSLSSSFLDEEQQSLLETGNSTGEGSSSNWTCLEFAEYLQTAKKAKTVYLDIFVASGVTLTVFPGVISDIECDAVGDWYGVLLVALFSFANLIPRMLSQTLVTTDSWRITALTGVHVCNIPVTFVVAQLFPNPFLVSTCITILGLFNGYLTLCCFALLHKLMDGSKEALRGGNLILFFLIGGLEVGSLFSVLWSSVI